MPEQNYSELQVMDPNNDYFYRCGKIIKKKNHASYRTVPINCLVHIIIIINVSNRSTPCGPTKSNTTFYNFFFTKNLYCLEVTL